MRNQIAKGKYQKAEISERKPAIKSFKLTLEYDGTKYHGWQEQANARTIQGEIRKAAEDFFDDRVELGGAGRTDAGVHALAQVASLKIFPRAKNFNARPQEILFALNDRLPADICLLDISPAHPNFHARYDAISRSYLYQISPRKSAFAKKHVWWVKDRLDVAAMQRAATMLEGRHDFAGLSKRDPSRPDDPTIVVVERADVTVNADLIMFQITASHYLWNMVRRIVGALVEVGRHNLSLPDFAIILQNKPHKTPIITAPAAGLFLTKVLYPQAPQRKMLTNFDNRK